MALPLFSYFPDRGETPETLARRRAIAQALIARRKTPTNVGEGLAEIGQALEYRAMMGGINQAETAGRAGAAEAFSGILPHFGGEGGAPAPTVPATPVPPPPDMSFGGDPLMPLGAEVEIAPQAATPAPQAGASGGTFEPFMSTVRGTVTNPHALAAIAATGRAESGFSQGNAGRTWNDPSESGAPGTAGGVMSWRGPRLAALQSFAQRQGGNWSDPAVQARFFLQENPQLIQQLQGAGSVGDAMTAMNNAWRFAGYDRPGGEAARRLGYANEYLPQFAGGAPSAPVQVASLDPAAGMGSAEPTPQPEPTAVQRVAQALTGQTPAYRLNIPGQAPMESQPASQAPMPIAPAQAGQGALPQALAKTIEAAKNPWVRHLYPGLIDALLKNQLEQMDPTKALQRQKLQMEIDAARNPPATFGEIGTDPATGQPIRGFIDPRARAVTPYSVPTDPNAPPSVIPPVPAGVDPKVWREAQSKRYTEEGMPASFEDTTRARKEIQDLPSYKNIAQAAPVYKSMLEAAGRDTRAADVNLIYGMAKIMDPGSVVRESEMTVAQAVATLPQQLRATVESQLTASGRLTSDVRAAIMQEAYGRLAAYQGMFDQDMTQFRSIVKNRRMREEEVIPTFGPFDEYKPSPVAAPPAGNMSPGRYRWTPQGLVPVR